MPETKIQHLQKISVHDFFFETPLYDEVRVVDLEGNILEWEVDGYSSRNHIDTTYTIRCNKSLTVIASWVYTCYRHSREILVWLVEVTIACKRKNNDVLNFFLLFSEEWTKLIKVWQHPSLADMQFAELWKKYDKVLPKEDLKNLKKAIWLNSHGAGAWSFVYLRRIFENLIFQTFNIHKSDIAISEEEFLIKRMEEKVDLLKEYLPEQLVAMRKIYSILSVWVHELSEEDCLKFFPALKLSIELILDQKIEMEEKKKKDELAQTQIWAILRNL